MQSNTIKYIGYLREEVEILEWWEKNKPTDQDYENTLSLISHGSRFVSSYSLLSCFDKAMAASYPQGSFVKSLTGENYDNAAEELFDWINTLDDASKNKACLYLAKMQNKKRLAQFKGGTEGNTVNRKDQWEEYFPTELTDFQSLPMQEVFIAASTQNSRQLGKTDLYGFADFTLNNSIYAKIYRNNSIGDKDSSELIKWILAPKEGGDVSIQITPFSYTQVGNPELVDDSSSSMGANVNIYQDVIYFNNGEAIKANVQSKEYFDNIEPLEKYALNIQKSSPLKIEDINIRIMLDRARSAALATSTFTSAEAFGTRSISYKLVFDITQQKSVIVPSVDLYQSLLYLQSMGSEEVSIYYDDVKRQIVIKGKSYSGTVNITKEGSRFKEAVSVDIPTFAIVYEQPTKDLTRFIAIEYVQFFDKELTFRDKYDLLNSKLNAPLELPEEFLVEYKYVSDSYPQQVDVAISEKPRSAKFQYVKTLAETYLDSYTELEVRYKLENDKGNWSGKWTFEESQGMEGSKQMFRKSIVSDEWLTANYVMKVNEAYWQYNDNMSLEDILSFFVSKGNDAGYRILSMKIIGVDYYLFEQAIISGLLTTNDIYVSKMTLDETNITADVKYESLNGFVSGNIYRKYEDIANKGENSYSDKLNAFFGADLGANLYDTSLTTINDAIENRHIPTLVPKAADENIAKYLELNVDIYNPIFFQSSHPSLTNAGTVPQKAFNTLLSTGKYENTLNIETKDNKESVKYVLGHFGLFKYWLEGASNEILGTYSVEEIVDAYIFPKQQDVYVREYILPLYKTNKGAVVGFRANGGQKKIKDIVANPDNYTLINLLADGKIKDTDNVTTAEKNKIIGGFKVAFRERFWGARREGRRLFNQFLRKEITFESQERIDFLWNKTYNNYAKPDLNKVPMFPSHSYMFGKRAEANRLVLAEAQKEGIRHTLSRKNSGLLLHEVGFGKTTSSITAISSMMNTGEASRVLFLVPNSVYDKFQDEIVGNDEAIGLLPNVNIVLLDNLSSQTLKSAKSNNKKGLKTFSSNELGAIEDFKVFSKNFSIVKESERGQLPVHLGGQCKIFSKLKRSRVTLFNDPTYTAASDWSSARILIRKSFDKEVKSLKGSAILIGHLNKLDDIVATIQTEWDAVYYVQELIINDVTKSEADKGKAQKNIETLSVTYSNNVSKALKQYVTFADVSLVDDLGYYKPQVMEEKTILIAKHTAVLQLRPTKKAVMSALMFKEGKGEQESTPTTLSTLDWSQSTGEDSNTRLTQDKVKVAVKILATHPISFERLKLDTLVVDEIHNFNNIVKRAGAKGIISSENNNDYYTGYKRDRKNRQDRRYPLVVVKGRGAEGTYVMKYDSTGRGSDSNGNKLTAAALCFDIQNNKKDVNNVILLSATPFTDTPFQVLSVLGMSNYDMLIDNGVTSAWDFFNNYVDETYKYDLTHSGGYGLFIDVNGYYNDKALSNLITNVANVKTTDEKIEANRPKKAIIPANKMKSIDGTASTAAPQMGDQFSELEFANSRVDLSDSQNKFQKIINEYLSDDDNQKRVSEIFPINEQRRNDKGLTLEEEKKLDETLKEMMAERVKEAKENKGENADLVITRLEDMYDRNPQYKQHPLIKNAIESINKSVYGVSPEAANEDDLGDARADESQMENTKKLAGKAIACQTAQMSLVLSPYMVNLGDKAYTSTFLEPLEPNPSKVFVESSPKLMFVVGCVSQALKYQEEQIKKGLLEKVGGQVIYFHKHNFDYGGKSYNGFDLLAEYLANNVDELSSAKDDLGNYTEIAKIDGNTSIEGKYNKSGKLTLKGRTQIKNEFNDGSIKILIGSKAIKEGIDLQGNSHSMYICEAEFSPEVAMQLEGRIWRQKNPYDVVRVIYVLAMNTIDSFIYSKINRKVTMIKNMLELGVYEMGTTQFVVDTKEMLLQLISDPDKLTAIQFQSEIKGLKEFVAVKEKLVARLRYVKSQYENISPRYIKVISEISNMYRAFGEIRREERKIKIRLEIAKRLSPQKKIDYEAAKKKGSKESMGVWIKNLSDSEQSKYKVNEKNVEIEYLQTIKDNPHFNPFPNWESKVLSVDTPFSELQIAANKVVKNLKAARQFDNTWQYADADEKIALRARENPPLNQKLYLAFYDAVKQEYSPTNFNTNAATIYEGELIGMFEANGENINCIKDYQTYILNNEEVNGIEDIDEVIELESKEQTEIKAKIDNEDDFKAEIRADWVKALAGRKEEFSGSLDDLIETMKASLPLIKLRKK